MRQGRHQPAKHTGSPADVDLRGLDVRAGDLKGLVRAYAPQSGIPAYQSLASFLGAAIYEGFIPLGTRLPSERALAEWASASRTTVQAAYRSLEASGYVETRPNVGTVVVATKELPKDVANAIFRRAFAKRTATINPGMILPVPSPNEGRPARFSFDVGMADPELIVTADMQLVVEELFASRSRELLAYGEPEGQPALRERVVSYLKRYRGIDDIKPENVLITSGSMQGLSLVAQAFIDPGDLVAIEDPTFPGALHAFSNAGAKFLAIPVDREGFNTPVFSDLMRDLYKKGTAPKLVYVQPTLQNPTGATMTYNRLEHLRQAANAYRSIIVEDDAYGILDSSPESKASYSRRQGRPAIYLGTFSKLLAPGLRVGFVVADAGIIRYLTSLKQASDLQTSALSQLVLEGWLAMTDVESYVEKARATYRERLDMALADPFFRDYADVVVPPAGGFYIWGKFKDGRSARDVRDAAAEVDVSFALGEAFVASQNAADKFRMSISTTPERTVKAGLQRLRQVMNHRAS